MSPKLSVCLLVALAACGVCVATASLTKLKNRFRSMGQPDDGGLVYGSEAYNYAAPQAQYYAQPAAAPVPPQYNYGDYAPIPYRILHPVPQRNPPPRQRPHQLPRHRPPQDAPQHASQQYYAVPPVVHRPLSRVAPKFQRRLFSPASVSTSAAVGGGAASAASAASGAANDGQGASSAGSATAGAINQRGGAASAAAAAAVESQHQSGHNQQHYHEPAGHDFHAVESEDHNEHFSEPETSSTFGTQSGSYANDGHGLETSSYQRSTESKEKHEDGREDDDHYYNAQSYGKTFDENNHEAYQNEDEDVLHTPTVFHKKKSNTNYVSDYNKARRESGSGVLAKDKHSSSYNKNVKKFKEDVDKKYRKEGAGLVDSSDYSSSNNIDDEDEEVRDNHGLGNFVGVDGVLHAKRPAFNAAAMAASAAAGTGGVASAASAAGH